MTGRRESMEENKKQEQHSLKLQIEKLVPSGIKRRWLLNNLSIVVLLLAIIFIAAGAATTNYYFDSLYNSLKSRANSTSQYLNRYMTSTYNEFYHYADQETTNFSYKDKMEMQVIDAYGRVMFSSTGLLAGCGFPPFEHQRVKAIVVTDFQGTRKQIDKLCADVEVQSGEKAYWFRYDENREIVGGIAKFVQPIKEQVVEALGLTPGCFVGLTAGPLLAAQKTAGVLRNKLGAFCPGHMDAERYEFCWIVDFPMYEIGEESGELEFCHNPFSMPSGGLSTIEKAIAGEIDPLSITADQYDLVCNGVELSSGAVRNHDPEIMIKAFQLVRLGEDDVMAKFPAMYNAFTYGAPPHAGIAPGVDRMVMLLTGEESIREVIPFPMNKNAQDLMMGAPSVVDQKQLDELNITCTAKEEE